MKRIKLVFMSVYMVLVLLLSASTTLANEPVSEWSDPIAIHAIVEQLDSAGDNVESVWTKLPPQAQEAVMKYLSVDEIVTEVSANPGEIVEIIRLCPGHRLLLRWLKDHK